MRNLEKDIIVLDDPFDPEFFEANKELIEDWYEKTLESRKQRDGDVIIVFSSLPLARGIGEALLTVEDKEV